MSFLGQINKRLNDKLVAKGKKPMLDENPRGISPSDIQELQPTTELVEPVIPPPPPLPEVGSFTISPLETITEEPLVEESEEQEVPEPKEEEEAPAPVVEVEKKKAKSVRPPVVEEATLPEVNNVKPAKKKTAKKKTPKKKAKKVSTPKPQAKKITVKPKEETKVLAINLPLDVHVQMEAFIDAFPEEAKSKRQLLRLFIDQGLERLKS